MAAEQILYSKRELYSNGKQRTFAGPALKEIAFPLGGLGTGTISLGGRGNLRDWEIYNRPNKGSALNFTFFALWVKPHKGEPVARILEGELQPPFTPGGGMPPGHLSGVRRLKSATFRGEYPFAWIDFEDDSLPVKVSLEAYNPFIPLNVEDSSIPVASFRWKITNPSSRPVDLTLAATMHNPVAAQLQDDEQAGPEGYWQNEYREADQLRGLYFTSTRFPATSANTGTAALCTSHGNVTAQTSWYQGGWWDAAHLFWDRFALGGQLHANTEPAQIRQGSAQGSLALHATIRPRDTVALPILLTWHTPHLKNGWSRQAVLDTYMKRQFRDAWHAAEYTAAHSDRLRKESMQWHDSIFSSTMPPYVLDAVTSQASILRTQTCVRLADGDFYAFEGCGDKDGCCAGNCTHVWNYEQSLAYLFPSLERSMRRTDFANVLSNGVMPFRTGLPKSAPPMNQFACGDGQMGTIIQAYRDWQLSGDDHFLREIWPNLKRALEYAWTEPDGWDPDKDGVMEGVQHNTYDIEFYGPNTMMGAMYLGALRAAEEMAEYLGETEKAEEYRKVYETGRARTETELWNGEYFMHKVEVMSGAEVPDHLKTPDAGVGADRCGTDCSCNGIEKRPAESEDHVVPKYQYGDGCLSDQLLGQWASHVAGLGYVLDPERVRKTVESIFRYNWRHPMGDFDSVQRIYALNDEAGLLLCSWPKGNRPALPFVYCDEVWTGIEYQVAAHLLYEGLVDEGLAIVKGVRDRHDGVRRNPWNEFECGHHYARALASWSVLLALSGYRYSAVDQHLSFAPKVSPRDFRCVYTTGSAWGEYSQQVQNNALVVQLSVRFGELKLRQLKLTWPSPTVPRTLSVETKVGRHRLESSTCVQGREVTIAFREGLVLQRGGSLMVRQLKTLAHPDGRMPPNP